MEPVTTLDGIREHRDTLLTDLKKRFAVVRDLVRGVGHRRYPGLYLFGRPGTSKSHTVIEVLQSEFGDCFFRQSGHLTPLGLFDLIKEQRDSVIVLDDLGELFRSRVAVQLLLAALEKPVSSDGGRPVTYRRKDDMQNVIFYGGIVAISNLVLHDAGLLGALRSRVHVINCDPPDAQLGALMLDIAAQGWPLGSPRPAVTAVEATDVAEFVIGELLRLGCRFDLRLLVGKALPVFLQWKKGETESHWQDLVSASAEEHLIVSRDAASPGTRAGRLAGQRTALEGILKRGGTRTDRIREFQQRTGLSQRTYYRRLSQIV